MERTDGFHKVESLLRYTSLRWGTDNEVEHKIKGHPNPGPNKTLRLAACSGSEIFDSMNGKVHVICSSPIIEHFTRGLPDPEESLYVNLIYEFWL